MSELFVRAYAIAGGPPQVPEQRAVALPPPGPRRRKARLPSLAVALAQRAAGDAPLPEAAVLLGTALGCQTETIAFVENMVREREAAPKPRAFSASVHNATASQVAIALGAQGENQTFVHGSLSLVHALWAAQRLRARGAAGPVLVGGLDERTEYVDRGRAECLPPPEEEAREGGAVLLLETSPEPLARITSVAFGRPSDPTAWLDARAGGVRIEAGEPVPERIALAVAVLAGEVPPAALDLDARPERCSVVVRSRFGELGLIGLERA